MHLGRRELFSNLPRITHLLILPNPNLTLPFVHYMLHKHLFCVLRFELANPPRIPQFARNTQIFAASYKSVGFAAFGGRGDAIGIEVVLFATGY
jgi:hypothetical protein